MRAVFAGRVDCFCFHRYRLKRSPRNCFCVRVHLLKGDPARESENTAGLYEQKQSEQQRQQKIVKRAKE